MSFGVADFTRALETVSGGFGSEGLDQALGGNHLGLPIGSLQRDPDQAAGLLVRYVVPAETLVNVHPTGDDVQAVPQVVENLRLGRQVAALFPERPLDIPGGEQLVWLVQSDVVVGVGPHPTNARTAVDEHHPVVAAKVLTCCEQGVQAGDSRADNADFAVIDL